MILSPLRVNDFLNVCCVCVADSLDGIKSDAKIKSIMPTENKRLRRLTIGFSYLNFDGSSFIAT